MQDSRKRGFRLQPGKSFLRDESGSGLSVSTLIPYWIRQMRVAAAALQGVTQRSLGLLCVFTSMHQRFSMLHTPCTAGCVWGSCEQGSQGSFFAGQGESPREGNLGGNKCSNKWIWKLDALLDSTLHFWSSRCGLAWTFCLAVRHRFGLPSGEI